jgi:hypothetical protein
VPSLALFEMSKLNLQLHDMIRTGAINALLMNTVLPSRLMDNILPILGPFFFRCRFLMQST